MMKCEMCGFKLDKPDQDDFRTVSGCLLCEACADDWKQCDTRHEDLAGVGCDDGYIEQG